MGAGFCTSFDLRAVFNTLVESAVRLCEARFGAVIRLDRDLLDLAAQHNFPESHLALLQDEYPMTPNGGARWPADPSVKVVPDRAIGPTICCGVSG